MEGLVIDSASNTFLFKHADAEHVALCYKLTSCELFSASCSSSSSSSVCHASAGLFSGLGCNLQLRPNKSPHKRIQSSVMTFKSRIPVTAGY